MRQVVWFAVLVMLMLLPGCEENAVTPLYQSGQMMMETGTIQGTVVLDPAAKGTLSNFVVELYASCEDMCQGNPTYIVLTNDKGEFAFKNMCCGKYFLGAWKDNDGNTAISSGDYSSDRSNPEMCCCEVMGGCTSTINLYASLVQ